MLQSNFTWVWFSHGLYFVETLPNQYAHGETKWPWYASCKANQKAGLYLRKYLPAKIFIELNVVTIFHKRPGTKFFPQSFSTPWMWGLPNLAFIRWWMQYTEREHARHVLKARFHSNYFTSYSGSDTQGSQEFYFHVDSSIWFRYPMTVHA